MATTDARGSSLLLDEYFQSGDERFLGELLACDSDKKLASLAERLFNDSRPFARKALLGYVLDGCDRPNHRPLVKRLFKLAELKGDDELMGHFLVAFDRLALRRIVTRYRYDWNTRQNFQETSLSYEAGLPARAKVTGKAKRTLKDPFTGKTYDVEIKLDREQRFSLRTRQYLARRAFRYFRLLGHRDPNRYRKAIASALRLYRDEHLRTPEALLDAWGLVHALWHGSKVLERVPQGIRLAAGSKLADLTPSPLYPEAWAVGFDDLVELVEKAESRTVRSWALALLKSQHESELRGADIALVRRLLKSEHDEAQVLGAELLRGVAGLENLPVAEWMELLAIENQTALPIVCELVQKHVTPERLTLEQCVALARSGLAPVAELGLGWAKQKPIRTEPELAALLPISGAGAPIVRAQAAEWLCSLLAQSKDSKPEHLRELIDSRFADVRERALTLFESDARFRDAVVLWSALAETPYDEVRTHLVRHLGDREKAFGPEALRRIWASTLLAVHRGGRAKRAVVIQLADRIVKKPGEAEALLPLLGIALRSIRAPERRAALAAIAQAAFRAPALRKKIEGALPELKLFAEEAA